MQYLCTKLYPNKSSIGLYTCLVSTCTIDIPTQGLEMEAAHVIFAILLYSVLSVSRLM